MLVAKVRAMLLFPLWEVETHSCKIRQRFVSRWIYLIFLIALFWKSTINPSECLLRKMIRVIKTPCSDSKILSEVVYKENRKDKFTNDLIDDRCQHNVFPLSYWIFAIKLVIFVTRMIVSRLTELKRTLRRFFMVLWRVYRR